MNAPSYQLMRVEEQDSIPVVVPLCSELRSDSMIARLEEELEQFLKDSGARQLVLDLSTIHFMSSGGLRLLIVLRKRLRELGGQFKMCGVHPYVADVFRTTRLFSESFDFVADVPAAIASLKTATPQ